MDEGAVPLLDKAAEIIHSFTEITLALHQLYLTAVIAGTNSH